MYFQFLKKFVQNLPSSCLSRLSLTPVSEKYAIPWSHPLPLVNAKNKYSKS